MSKLKSPYAIELENISKRFGPKLANDHINLKLKHGEIHALLGENGAGKSTLMNILFGLIAPDEGVIKKDGVPVVMKSPNDANRLKIGMVHQHFKLVEIYTVLENIILGDEPKSKSGIFLKKNEARKKVEELSKKYGLSLDLDAKIEDITVGMQQRTEICKMLYRDNDVLIFDEPTAVLTPQEIRELMATMKKLASENCSILFITHHLDEIMEIADRCTIISKGRYIDTVDVKNTTKEELSRKMIGRDVTLTDKKKKCNPGDVMLSVKNLSVKTDKGASVKNVSFDVHKGEIVCIAGIDGNGQTELVGAISGMQKVQSGTITLNGKDITNASIRKRSKSGMSHIPEDRLKHAMVGPYSVEQNLILQRYFDDDFSTSMGILKQGSIRSFSENLIEQFDIQSIEGSTSRADSLSGGNQQKMVVAREIEKKPQILLAFQPVRGLDVGAIELVHSQIVKVRDDGRAVLLVSFELEEVLNLADRILVMFEGEIVAEFLPKETNADELGLYMAGGKRMTKKEEKQ